MTKLVQIAPVKVNRGVPKKIDTLIYLRHIFTFYFILLQLKIHLGVFTKTRF